MWGFTAAAFLAAWRDCVVRLDLQEFMVSPYQARHGRASRDYIMRKRSEEEIWARGHWSTTSAARIYRKPGRIQQLVARLKPASLGLAKEYGRNFAKLFRSGSFRAAARAAASELGRAPDGASSRCTAESAMVAPTFGGMVWQGL